MTYTKSEAKVVALKKRREKWLATVFRGYEPGADGKQKRLEHSKTFDLKKDAERWLREQRGEVERGQWVRPADMTLNAYLDQWQRGALALGGQRDRTKQSYRELLASYIRPRIGFLKLERVTRSAVQQAAAELLAQTVGVAPKDGTKHATLSPVTVRRALAALSVALRDAVDQRLISTNPARGIKLPRPERKALRWLNREEVRTLIDGTRDDRHGALWTLLATTGLRPSEALGLQWEHVDLTASAIRVQQALVPQAKAKTGATWKLDEPKTARSRRAVPVPAESARVLQRLKARNAAERLAAGEAYTVHGVGGFVFAHENGEPYRQDALMQLFGRTLLRLGLPHVTLYSLRHGHASMLMEAGVPLKVVSERLGHSSIQLTADTYSHVSDQMQQGAVEKFAAYMGAPLEIAR
jgi:integrase